MKHSTLRAAMLGGLLLGTALTTPAFMAAPTPAEQITSLETQREEIMAASQAIMDGLADGVELSDEQADLITANSKKVESFDKRITALKTMVSQPQGRRSTPEANAEIDPATGRRRVPAEARQKDPRGGFKTGFGEYAMAVKHGSIQGNTPDTRLTMAASTFGNEGSGSDGGFLVPPEYAAEIWTKVQAEENLLERCAPLQTGSNSIVIPKDEVAPWDNTQGVRAYWEAEAGVANQTKPTLEMSQIRLAKLFALVPISDELLEDAIGLESWLNAKAPGKMAAKINTAIISGTGVGQPLGMLKAPSLISVAKETSQPSATIYFANINKMWARMYAPWRRNSIWLINQDIEPQLDAMAFDPAATSKVPVYLPPGGVSNADYATLKGRPVVPVEATSALGAQGDIILCDLNQYWGITRSGGVRTDTSMHLYFDQGLTAFRFTFRLNGQPAWSKTIAPQNGSANTRGWAVTLDAR